jgi:hypothetical protein
LRYIAVAFEFVKFMGTPYVYSYLYGIGAEEPSTSVQDYPIIRKS